ncbi:arsenical pump-driving ATPase [Streptomyces sp. MNU76]|uniref:arsenical pump-driving ATPase n=1 Tax=Streptomyces sp. MNU76 TaxID=2560026 RepID=UPI001E2B2958|nr:arsenical pump-driving ATPase [Streptomyces sp. MNU76]MCC9710624.1 arsenical pump-driving ATPase [Streptomyces sp. MNU76]
MTLAAPSIVLGGLRAAATPYLFFTGKGGVGKTSTSSAAAVGLADADRKVLLVSTDPASNLNEVLGAEAGQEPTPVPGAPGLYAMNIDPAAAAAQYREKVVGPYRAALPASAIAQIEEQLSGACTVEIAAFNEFVALLTDPQIAARFDHVVFDTAPTGHTIRLLSLPAAWSDFLITNPGGASCIGPLAELGAQQQRYAQAMEALADPARTTVVLVTRPDTGPLEEAGRTASELRALGIGHQRLVINGVFTAARQDDPLAVAWQRRGEEALAQLPSGLADITEVDRVPLLAVPPVGLFALRAMLAPQMAAEPLTVTHVQGDETTGLGPLMDEITDGGNGLVMTMGKGGVGKTTVAAAVAADLARRGHPVTLTTTDPAAHVEMIAGAGSENLRITRIDPAAETAAYTAAVLAQAGASLDEDALRLMAEDLDSPCTEEIAVFYAFARTVAEAADRFVVVDTAPTGHTLLLLDASRGYQRQLSQQTGQTPPSEAMELLNRLTDPDYTRILLVTLPEATPVHEAAALQTDLDRAGIKPFAWVVNQSLAVASPLDPLLAAKAAAECRYLSEVTTEHAERTVVLPWTAAPPIGTERLLDLAAGIQ